MRWAALDCNRLIDRMLCLLACLLACFCLLCSIYSLTTTLTNHFLSHSTPQLLFSSEQRMGSSMPRVSELSPLQMPLAAFEGDGSLQDLSPSRMVSSNPESLSSQPHKPEAEQVGCCVCRGRQVVLMILCQDNNASPPLLASNTSHYALDHRPQDYMYYSRPANMAGTGDEDRRPHPGLPSQEADDPPQVAQVFAGEQGAPPRSQAGSTAGAISMAGSLRSPGLGSTLKAPPVIIVPGSSGGGKASPSPRGHRSEASLSHMPSGSAKTGIAAPSARARTPKSPIFSPATRARMTGGDSGPSSPTDAGGALPSKKQPPVAAGAATLAATRGSSGGRVASSRIPSTPAAGSGTVKEGAAGSGFGGPRSARGSNANERAPGRLTPSGLPKKK